MSKNVKIAFMSLAHFHGEAYLHYLRAMPGVELIGIADDDAARAQRLARQYETRHFPGYEALLAERPDGVVICSENARHRPLVELAASAGAAILCEKPLATTLADGQAMVNACRNAGVTLMTAFPMRFSAPLLELKAALDAGDLGSVYCLNGTNQGRIPIAHDPWFVDPELAGGGALMDHIVHLADIYNWFFGPDIAAVYAQSNQILHAGKVTVETGGLVMLTYQNGLFATIDCSWSKPLNYPTWGGLTIELVAERGLSVVDPFNQNLHVYRQQPAAHRWAPWGSDMDQALVAEFVNAIREKRPPTVTGEDGLFALAVTLAAYQSAATGQPQPLSPAFTIP